MVKKHLTYCPFKYPYHPSSISWHSHTKSLIIWGCSSSQTWLIFNFYLLFMNAVPELLFLILCGGARWRRWTKEMVSVARSPQAFTAGFTKNHSRFGDPSLPADFSMDEPIKICIRVSCRSGSSRVYVCIVYMYTKRTDILDMPAYGHFYGR
jgi:hypothetical protein